MAATNMGYSGDAYGTKIHSAPGTSTVKSGRSAVSSLCTEKGGVTKTNKSGGLSEPPLGSTGGDETSVSSQSATTGDSTVATAKVNKASLLGGLIIAGDVKAVSTTTSGSQGFSTSAAGSGFTNTMVLGVPVASNVPPNTTMTLPGVGTVILNEQKATHDATSASLSINMIHIMVTMNNTLNLPVGTEMVIAHAYSSIVTNIGLLRGFGYGSTLTGAGTLDSGRSAEVTIGCTGTGDHVVKNQDLSVSIPGIASTGQVSSKAKGDVTSTMTTGDVIVTVKGAKALASLVSATSIKAVVHVDDNGTTVTLDDKGSEFQNLAVTGHPEVGSNPPPNTKVPITGLGTLYLHRVIKKADSIEVRMVELVVDSNNSFNLPSGSHLLIAVAGTGIRK